MSISPKASRPGDIRVMPAIGITGGISTGKSTFVEGLRKLLPLATFFDADEAVHALLNRPDGEKQIRREFGAQVFASTGDLNRTKLRAIVFADATKKLALEQILHPRIRRQWRTEAKGHRNSPKFFLLRFHFFMRPVVKAYAIEWLWWPVRRRCSWPGYENGCRSGAPKLNK